MTKDLLIEIGTEEIPAGFLPPALAKWREAVARLLEESRLTHGEARSYGTPRRLVLVVEEVAERQADTIEERSGPFVAQAFDREGKPTKAGEGFARSCGVSLAELARESTAKGEKLVYRKQVTGKNSLEFLAAKLPGLIREIPFPKTMRWGEGELRFARPIHWILALLGGEVVPFSLDGIQSGRATRGHRFTHPQAIAVEGWADYMDALDRADVTVDPGLRQELIEKQIARLAEELGGEAVPEAGLVEEVTWLTEDPIAVTGHFDEKYLQLPREVLIESMAKHQRYFAVQKKGSAELLNGFITIANTPAKDLSVVARGNERVLRARLSDAEFFYKEDSKVSLEKFAEKLSGVVFQAKLGTYAEKAERIAKLAGWLAEQLAPADAKVKAHAERAARLCKADLVTQMVFEFPSLQGIMGGYYAAKSGEDKEVAEGICDHYLPGSFDDIKNDKYPFKTVGKIVSIADKIDSIVGCWGVGLAPTGSADAFAIRRQTLGIIHILWNNNISLSIVSLVEKALEVLQGKINKKPSIIQNEVIEFFRERLRNLMIDGAEPFDIVDSILSVWNGDVPDATKRIRAMRDWKYASKDFEPLMIAFKRVVRIIEGEPGPVKQDLFEHQTEKELYQGFKTIAENFRPLIRERKYAEALSELATLKPAVDKFFDEVRVNVEDAKVKANRHALLAEIRGLFQEFADFSKVVTAG